MPKGKSFIRRGKIGKFVIGDILYFISPSHDKTRNYHYKQILKSGGHIRRTYQINREKYDAAKRRKEKESRD